jgi:hypothetical protein
MSPKQKYLSNLMVVAFLVLTLPVLRADDDSWEADVQQILDQQLACTTPIDDLTPCNVFLGRALKRVYGIDDFEVPGKPDTFLSANQIVTYVSVTNSDKWTSLGTANSQEALDQAQSYANGHPAKAVIAVWMGTAHGHVALIVPGQEHWSSTWKSNVPNSASFVLQDEADSYVGGLLSKAFGPDKKAAVTLYGRN